LLFITGLDHDKRKFMQMSLKELDDKKDELRELYGDSYIPPA